MLCSLLLLLWLFVACLLHVCCCCCSCFGSSSSSSITIVAVAVASSKLTWINSYKIIEKMLAKNFIHMSRNLYDVYRYLLYTIYIYIYISKVIVPTTTIYIHSLLFTASKTENKMSPIKRNRRLNNINFSFSLAMAFN